MNVYYAIKTYDVVITTFDTKMRTERWKHSGCKVPVDFCNYIFHRLIVDEFHQGGVSFHKNGTSLTSHNVWCVSGTIKR